MEAIVEQMRLDEFEAQLSPYAPDVPVLGIEAARLHGTRRGTKRRGSRASKEKKKAKPAEAGPSATMDVDILPEEAEG